jgi:hypothetical protein
MLTPSPINAQRAGNRVRMMIEELIDAPVIGMNCISVAPVGEHAELNRMSAADFVDSYLARRLAARCGIGAIASAAARNGCVASAAMRCELVRWMKKAPPGRGFSRSGFRSGAAMARCCHAEQS